ncbi:uncharacterized protein LAESUDRAFT_722290 [Laetiporus sulphureus 93-53]|uniref:DUF1275 domain protein n=1 Tax=Laetiporus sulphureus 93-53 TaxID=1314785 RepID=A0A165GBT1_9APHY|nr:uncharacterized protein LAESUDRAFT_722290 [Laetiporus sulphureus 93-53]KZT10126.1 hypothetical protein LAESUDRAFT_722290 [Laetiporus sulphureus 93-53]
MSSDHQVEFGPEADVAPPTVALLILCLSTGFIDSLTFAATGVWCAFVTGTTVQLGMNAPGLFDALTSSQRPTFKHALSRFVASTAFARIVALSGFLCGAAVGSNTPVRNLSLTVSGAVQAVLLACAATLVLQSLSGTPDLHIGLPRPHAVLALVSASMSLQAELVRRAHTPFGTSVAWTSIWLDMVDSRCSRMQRAKKASGLMALVSGAAIGALTLRWGRSPEESDSEAAIQLARRVGWGFVVATLVKVVVVGMFWRKERAVGRIRLG